MDFGYNRVSPFMGAFFANAIIRRLRENSAKCENIYNHVDLAFSFEFNFLGLFSFNIKPFQNRWEITQLLRILEEAPPKTIVEIGTAQGGSLYLFTRVSRPDAILVSIDLPGGPYGGGYPAWKIPIYKSFASANQKEYLFRMDSHDESTLEKTKRLLAGSKVDFLFIDGDHSYDGVKKDFEMYRRLVRRGGIIAFHDIVPGPRELVGDVPNFWKRIRQKFCYEEIVENWSQGTHGIGIIFTK
jgi:predicted O-methyltransferase YrrM